jgi:hypothetical protein
MTSPPRGDRPHRAGPVLAIGVVVSLFAAGGVYWGIHTGPGGPDRATITLGAPKYVSLVCSAEGPIYFETLFTVTKVVGSATTKDFGISVLSRENRTISPNGSAPGPTTSLPCGAPTPSGWYAVLEPAHVNGSIATYPATFADSVGAGWSNATFAPVPVPSPGWLVLITAGDFSGSGDHLVAFGMDGATVSLAGNTTFPGFRAP